MPNNDHEPPVEMNGKVIEKFLGVEEKRIEVDTLRGCEKITWNFSYQFMEQGDNSIAAF